VNIARVEKARARVRVMLGGSGGEETIEASHILVATGRVANVDGLGLDAAGIIHEPRGIRVNRLLRTSNRKVYAVGDVVLGSPQFTHVATHHAGLVIRSALLRLSVDASRAALPRIIGTDPELAHVGLSEQEARKLHKSIRVLRWPLQENDRAVAEAETAGHCKIVTAKNGRVLGATLVGARASELIALWTLAIGRGLTVGAIADTVFPYPNLAEIGRSVAASFSTPGLTNPWTRRIIGFLRRFG
jgi:pyruvate/2-oxoglutarate dehydrogenase complex dihydrolipoamide dehydrogenase (E3) component